MRTCERVSDDGQELLHVAEARGPLHQRAHRHAVALHRRFDIDHITGIEPEGLHHVEPIGGVVVGQRGGSQHQAGRRRLRALHRHLVERIVQLRQSAAAHRYNSESG